MDLHEITLQDLDHLTNTSEDFENAQLNHNDLFEYRSQIKKSLSSLRFSHFQFFRLVWEYIVILDAIVAIMDIGFVFFVNPDISFSVYWISFIFDIIFVIDYFVICHTVFFKDGKIVSELHLIKNNYGKISLIIHFIACIPFSWIGVIIKNKWVFLILSFTKFLRLHRGFRGLINTNTLLPYCNPIAKLFPAFFLLLFAIYLFALIFFIVGREEGFLNSYLGSFASQGFSNVQLYFTSIYFVMTTILTVGFGDITPQTNIEIIIAILLEIIGVSLNVLITAYMVAAMIDTDRTTYISNYSKAESYLKSNNISPTTLNQFRNYCQYQWDTNGGPVDLKIVLQSIPLSIRQEIILETLHPLLMKTKIFSHENNQQLLKIVHAIEYKTFSPSELICTQGDKVESLIFLTHGIVQYILDGSSLSTESCDEGIIISEYEFLSGQTYPYSLQALTYVQVWSLSREYMLKLLHNDPSLHEVIVASIYENYRDCTDEIFSCLELKQHSPIVIEANDKSEDSLSNSIHFVQIESPETKLPESQILMSTQ